MAITDLTNTKWQVNEGWSATTGYGKFSIEGIIDGSTNYPNEIQATLDIGYTIIWNEEPSFTPTPDHIGLWTKAGTYAQYSRNSFTLEITGGTDTTNTKLISWLETNATQIKDAILELVPFLTNIANAIRNKKGTTEPINAQNFASEIESIESGGGNWTEESGYNGALTLTGWSTSFHLMYMSILESGSKYLIYENKNTSNAAQTYQYSGVNMFMVVVANPMSPTTIANTVNVEILDTNDYSYVIFKPTADNWTISFTGGD